MSHRLPVIPWVQSRLSCSERQSFGWLQAVQGHNALGSAISAPRSIDPKQNICFVSLPAEETRREGGCVRAAQVGWAAPGSGFAAAEPHAAPNHHRNGGGDAKPLWGQSCCISAFPRFHTGAEAPWGQSTDRFPADADDDTGRGGGWCEDYKPRQLPRSALPLPLLSAAPRRRRAAHAWPRHELRSGAMMGMGGWGWEDGGGLRCVIRGGGSAGEAPRSGGTQGLHAVLFLALAVCTDPRARLSPASHISAPLCSLLLFFASVPRSPALPPAARPHPGCWPLYAVRGDAAGHGALLSSGCEQAGR